MQGRRFAPPPLAFETRNKRRLSQHDATRICCWAPAHAAQRPQVSIAGAQQQTRRPLLLLSIDGTDWRTRTPDRDIDTPPHTMRQRE